MSYSREVLNHSPTADGDDRYFGDVNNGTIVIVDEIRPQGCWIQSEDFTGLEEAR